MTAGVNSNMLQLRAVLTLLLLLALSATTIAQSTFGVILGSVRDPSGAAVVGATVKLTNTGENTTRQTKSNDAGDYEFQNVKPGAYAVEITQSGFRTASNTGIQLVARQTARVDADLQVGEMIQTVEVASAAGVIATDTPVVASTLTPEKVLGLPVNVRGGGSTSPYALIAALPGVQSDNGGGFSIQGGVPAQTESSSDGISITAVTGNSPNRNLFPSIESIAEIKVQGVGNNAEYGTPGDIATISRSGTNNFHRALFWYHQNKAFDSRAFNQPVLPAKIGNTFGVTVGGPLILPKIYNGRNRTFFFFTWESFRFPRQTTLTNTVPTVAMRNGDFSAEPNLALRDAITGTPLPGNVIPASRINEVSKKIIPFYPDPNIGNTARFAAANFVENRRADIESDQYDIRLDHQFSSSHSLFGRYSQKVNTSTSPNNLTLPSDTGFNNYKQAVVSYNWTIRPTLLNEFRSGISYAPSGSTFPFDGLAFANSLNLKDIQRDIFFNALPNFSIDRQTGFSKGRPGRGASWNTQFIDNVTWIKGRHTIKFGADIRKLRAETNLGFTTGDNYGDYGFSGNFTGAPWGDFLFGTPIATSIAVVQLDNDGRATHYKTYIQDSFRMTKRFTLEFGVRYELHPGYKDAGFNIANFDRTIARTGQVVLPTDPKARQFVAPAVLTSVNACPAAPINGVPCTPFVTASEAGIPESLRNNYNTQFLPRLGFAYRLNDKTTIRGGAGMYNMILLGSVFFSLTGTVQSDVRNFDNIANGRPIFALPETRPPNVTGVRAGSVGTFEFRTANQIDFRPPQMLQWNLTIDRQLNNNTGLRLSYIANKSTHMPWAPDLNQPLSSNTYYTQRPLTDRPFPNWGLIYSRDAGANSIYNSFQGELNRRFSGGLTYNVAYTLAKHLGDAAGPNPNSFAGETGGGRVTNSYNRRADRGDVYATRRHRFVNSFVYDLPFGKGRKFMGNANRFADSVLGGWSITSLIILQSGPYLTPVFSGGDPSGTNAPRRGTQRPDRVGAADGSIENADRVRWLDRAAFFCPGRSPGAADQFNCSVGVVPGRDIAPIGRFGNSGVGIVLGPGSFSWNAGMRKSFPITENVRLRLEGSFVNLPNWTNLGDPVLNINDNNFGRITGTRGSDFGGNRTGQVSLRLEF